MKKTTLILIIVIGIGFCNCKKAYTCECKNPQGEIQNYTTKNTKKKAQQVCSDLAKDYLNDPNHQTTCSLK